MKSTWVNFWQLLTLKDSSINITETWPVNGLNKSVNHREDSKNSTFKTYKFLKKVAQFQLLKKKLLQEVNKMTTFSEINNKSKKRKKVKIKIKLLKQRSKNTWKNCVLYAKNLNVVFSAKAIVDVLSMKNVTRKCKIKVLLTLMTFLQKCRSKNFVWRMIN